MDALQFLDKAAKPKRQPVVALVGDEDFLKRRARDKLIAAALGDADPAFAVSVYPGDKLDFSTVRNDLDTRPFLAPCRVVVVDAADKFVSDNREALERYVAKPSADGVLILDVTAKTFAPTTKLAKALPDAAKIACKAPPEAKLADWCVAWAKAAHDAKLTADAAGLLVELVGTAMGQLDQEIEKLAVAVGPKAAIKPEDVDRLVERTREANVFHILDAIGDGKPAVALGLLGRAFADGEDPMGVFARLAYQLRKLAAVGRLIGEGQTLGAAMDAAGVKNWGDVRLKFERQVRWLGRRRLDKLSEWLVELDLGLKGGNPLPERVQVERLVVRLARPRE